MFPFVMRELSKTRSKNIFIKTPRYDDKVIWEKAQKLQKHIYYSSDVFIFGNYRFVEKKYQRNYLMNIVMPLKLQNLTHNSQKRFYYIFMTIKANNMNVIISGIMEIANIH